MLAELLASSEAIGASKSSAVAVSIGVPWVTSEEDVSDGNLQ